MGQRPNVFKRKYFINRRFQTSVIVYTTCLVLLTISVIYLSYLHHYEALVARGQALGLGEGHVYYKLIREQKNMMFESLTYVSLIVILGTGMFSLLLSHKVAGPLSRLIKYLEDGASLQQAPQEPLQFRAGDYFPEIPQALNKFIAESKRRNP